jgi:DNA-binding LytR/AlgR family response regulator
LFKISKIHHASSKNSKENVVSRWEAFVKNSSTHPEIRDMRRVLANPRAFAGLGLAAVLVTIIQPFGLRVPGPIGLTLMYWLLMIAVTFPLDLVISAACMAVCRQRWCAAVMAPCAMAIAVTISTHTLNIISLSWDIWEVKKWRLLAVTAGPVAAHITVLIHIIQAPTATVADPPQSPKAPAPPALLNRLPLDMRRAIYHMAAEDHYTRITTTRGSSLVLLRFSDALQEVAPTPGSQVYRSHWVSFDAIDKVECRGDGARLILSDGAYVPVSRSHMAILRAKGIV